MNVPGSLEVINQAQKRSPGSCERHELERNSCLHLKRTRRYKVGAAEGREKIVKRDLVGDIHSREAERHLCAFAP